MPLVPLAARVVEVIADLGGSYRYGSGFIVRAGTVLTAAHVVAGAVSVSVRDPDKRVFPASVGPRFTGDVNGPGPDLALLEIDDPGPDLPPIGLARVDRDSPTGEPVRDCQVIGYPAFMVQDTPDGGQVRETADATGEVPVLGRLAGGLLSVQVTHPPRPLPPKETALGESEWSGMSGAPVLAGGLLLGVVSEHAPREGPSAITAIPLTALEADPDHPGWGPGVADPAAWWARLGCSGAGALRRLPAPPVRKQPAYWATVREIHQRTATLVGRHQELAEIASFVDGAEGYRWLTGGAWAGKTSLLAETVAMLQGECDVVCYFLSRREAYADSSRFLAAVVPQLAYLLEEDPPAAESHEYRALWQRAVQRADAEDRDLLLVVDGLDEDLRPPGLPSVAALLPLMAGDRAHVLVSSRPYPELPADLPPGHPLARTQPVQLVPFEGGQELAELARQEIDGLVRRPGHLAIHMPGLLAAAAGPLAVGDLIRLSHLLDASSTGGLSGSMAELSLDDVIDADRFLTEDAARSVQPVGMSKDAERQRYQYAHESLLEYAQQDRRLGDRRFRDAIHRWARSWSDVGWPVIADDPAARVPEYLLANYPSTLTEDPPRLAALAGDAGWVTAAIRTLGVDAVLAELKTARTVAPGEPRLAAMHAVVRVQAHHLRDREAAGDPGFVPRQLCLQATEFGETLLAADFRTRQLASDDPGPVLQWTTRRANPALILELGRDKSRVEAVAALPDGRVVTGGAGGGRVLVWDPDDPGAWPGRARPSRRRSRRDGGAAGRPSGHRRRRRRQGPGAGVGPGRPGRRPGRSRPRLRRRWAGGAGGATGRAGRQRQHQGLGAGVGPGRPGRRPGQARPRHSRRQGGGGAAGRAGGHRRRHHRRRPGAGVGPGRPGRRPGRARPPPRHG